MIRTCFVSLCRALPSRICSKFSNNIYRRPVWQHLCQRHFSTPSVTILERPPLPSAAKYIERGQIEHKQSNFSAAIEDYTAAIELDRKNVLAYSLRGDCRLRLKQYQDALDDFTYVIGASPSNLLAFSSRAFCKAKLGKRDEAMEELNLVIKSDPRLAEAYTQRAILLRDAGNFSAALIDYQKVLRIEGLNNVSANLGAGECSMMLKQFPIAEKHYKAVLSVDRNNPEALEGLAFVYSTMESEEAQKRAIEYLEQCIRVTAARKIDTTRLEVKLAYSQISIGDFQAAYNTLNKVCKSDDSTSIPYMAFMLRGHCYYQFGQLTEAVRDYTSTIDLVTQSSNIPSNERDFVIAEMHSARGLCFYHMSASLINELTTGNTALDNQLTQLAQLAQDKPMLTWLNNQSSLSSLHSLSKSNTTTSPPRNVTFTTPDILLLPVNVVFALSECYFVAANMPKAFKTSQGQYLVPKFMELMRTLQLGAAAAITK